MLPEENYTLVILFIALHNRGRAINQFMPQRYCMLKAMYVMNRIKQLSWQNNLNEAVSSKLEFTSSALPNSVYWFILSDTNIYFYYRFSLFANNPALSFCIRLVHLISLQIAGIKTIYLDESATADVTEPRMLIKRKTYGVLYPAPN